ncbi:ABC transporter ATP-binding protein/permease [Escherichia coli]|uniref:ABC transporter ATP-binding protein/permease n=1 Tax=Escherichia coli TaxID=562 RepID=A0A2X1MTZ7_ECOLX|nr:ABC transporter ATP-binding protein/permease [Escherichia coli]
MIALSNAESLQRQELSDNFHTIKENWASFNESSAVA